MLRHLPAAGIAVACVLALACTTSDAEAAKEPPKKSWQQLRDKPVDYAPYERRRAENLKLGTTPVSEAFARGFATVADLGGSAQQQTWVITDEALSKALAERAKKLLPDSMGIKAPEIAFVIKDDLGLLAAAQASGRGVPEIEALLKRDEASFTAFATGGGAIVLGLSVLKVVKTYDELDFLIGHEMSHILKDHHTEEEEYAKLGKALAIVTLIGTIATQRSDTNTRENVAWTALGLFVAYGLLGPSWDREQEEESDELGYELLLEAGLSADGAGNIFDKIQKKEEAYQQYLDVMCGPDSAGERFFKGLITSIIGIKIPEQGYAPQSPVCAERRNLFAALLRDHPDVDDRRKFVKKHHAKFYADVPDRAVTSVGDGSVTLMEFLSPDGSANRLSQAYDGLKAFHAGDLATARVIAKKLAPGKGEIHVPVLELSFYVSNADGRRAEALGYLETAMTAPQTAAHIFLIAEQEYVKDKRWRDAARVLEFGVRRGIASRQQILVQLINYLRLAGDFTRMEAVLAECKALDLPGMTLACEATAHPPPPTDVAPAPGVASPPVAPRTP